MEIIGTTLCNSIDSTTSKTTLTNVERSNIHLNLLNSLHWYRLCTSSTTIRSVTRKTKHVVVGSTVNHERVITVTGTCKRHCTTICCCQLWIKSSYIGNTVRDTWHISNLLRVDTLCSTCLGCVDTCTTLYNNLLKFLGVVLKRTREIFRFTQTKCYIIKSLCLLTNVSYGHLVRTTDAHTLNSVTTIDVRHSTVNSSWRLVGRCNGSTNNIFTLRHYLTTDSWSCNLCHDSSCHCKQQRNQEK